MAARIRSVSYYYLAVKDQPGEAYKLLERLAELGINLLAFTAIPIGPSSTQLTIFPEDEEDFTDLAKHTGLVIDGPHHAILVQGKDKIGALAEVHKKIYSAGINVYATNGVAAGSQEYGYILYVRPESFSQAVDAL
ncbi:MAG: hypothetical protein KDC66_12960, partial [Phaeodactylibacter sp.]|nr:hypothetical protein [Phaeodactylibacter sp.]